MPPSSTTVSVVIPTFRREATLRQLLSDLARQGEVEGEVIVVDQNDPPLGRDLAPPDGCLGPLRIRILHRPRGVVAARNAGAAAATGAMLVFLDDDVRVDDPLFLKKHGEACRTPGVAAVCGQELVPPNYDRCTATLSSTSPFEEAMFFPRNSTQRREVCVLSTCNCSLRAEVFRALGGFDPAYRGSSYGDDADLALRLRAAGHRMVFEPSASVRHLKSADGGLRLMDPANRFTEREKYISAWLFFFRHVPPRWRRWYLWHGILRKSLFLKVNFYRPHRWPSILAGLFLSLKDARRLTRR